VHELWIGSTAPGAAATSLGITSANADFNAANIGAVLSPDGRQLIAIVPKGGDAPPETFVVDLATRQKTPVYLGADPNWQRLAN
jgi:hypothetical protein